ncbi:Lipase 1-like protein 4 [Seiridium cupressi]
MGIRRHIIFSLGLLLPIVHCALSPIVKTRNGTYLGIELPNFDQEAFLGVPYAQPPVGQLRLRPPQSLNSSFSGEKPAVQYGYTCPGGDDATVYDMNEDCLTLNIVRPKYTYANNSSDLAVLVWIYGGGFQTGATSDPMTNLSYIVQTSAKMGKPIIAASLNYRKATFGFLGGRDMVNSANMNLGLRDQRRALDWIQENIDAFGGNPEKATIFGQSSGGAAVGFQLGAWGATGKPPFRAAIMQSGSSNSQPDNGTDYHQPMYEEMLSGANCSNVSDHLDCLRRLSYDDYVTVSSGLVFFPTVDGSFVPAIGSIMKAAGSFHKVPIIAGTTTDDATLFAPLGRDTDEELMQPPVVQNTGYTISNHSWTRILKLYPDDPVQGIPAETGSDRFEDNGYQYKRICATGGDILFQSPRRQDCRVFSNAGLPVFSYRFNTIPYVSGTNDAYTDFVGTLGDADLGVKHGSEMPFVFNNPQSGLSTVLGPEMSYHILANIMCRMWISFAASQDPNGHGIEGVPEWLAYGNDDLAQNFVFHANTTGGGYMELDNVREMGMDFLIETQAERVQ